MGNFDASTRGHRPPANYNYKRAIVQLTSTNPQAVYTNSTEGKQRLYLAACNTSSSTSIYAYLVVSGGSATVANAFWYGVPLEANETVAFPFEVVLEGGDAIWVESDAANQVNILVAATIEV